MTTGTTAKAMESMICVMDTKKTNSTMMIRINIMAWWKRVNTTIDNKLTNFHPTPDHPCPCHIEPFQKRLHHPCSFHAWCLRMISPIFTISVINTSPCKCRKMVNYLRHRCLSRQPLYSRRISIQWRSLPKHPIRWLRPRHHALPRHRRRIWPQQH